jgi:hypothetical protein
VIVDRDVNELPASGTDLLAVSDRSGLSSPVARDAMPGSQDPAELLDVDMDQLS